MRCCGSGSVHSSFGVFKISACLSIKKIWLFIAVKLVNDTDTDTDATIKHIYCMHIPKKKQKNRRVYSEPWQKKESIMSSPPKKYIIPFMAAYFCKYLTTKRHRQRHSHIFTLPLLCIFFYKFRVRLKCNNADFEMFQTYIVETRTLAWPTVCVRFMI